MKDEVLWEVPFRMNFLNSNEWIISYNSRRWRNVPCSCTNVSNRDTLPNILNTHCIWYTESYTLCHIGFLPPSINRLSHDNWFGTEYHLGSCTQCIPTLRTNFSRSYIESDPTNPNTGSMKELIVCRTVWIMLTQKLVTIQNILFPRKSVRLSRTSD